MITPSGEVRRVAQVVLDRIFDESYPSGLRLPPEAALAEELGCGRSTLREALRHLAGLGLVQSRRGSGATVLDFRREGAPALLPAYIRAGRFDVEPARLAREMLRMRTWMATEAVRLAARYAEADALAEARGRLAAAPALESDPAAHALNELELYRALVAASRIYPAIWMVNAFWTPLRELNALFAPMQGCVDPAFQPTLERLLCLVEEGDETAAVGHIEAWFRKVDAGLLELIEGALSLQDPTLQDPTLQDPTLQDPTLQDPTLQDPTLQDPSLENGSLQTRSLQNGSGFDRAVPRAGAAAGSSASGEPASLTDGRPSPGEVVP